jgi:uncharacterized protein (DUF1800 family)
MKTSSRAPLSLSLAAIARLIPALVLATAALTAQVITVAPQSQAVAAGANVALSVTATGSGLSYQWRFNGTNLPGQTGPTLPLTNIQPATTGIYSVVVTSTTGTGVTSVTSSAIIGLTATAKVTPANAGQEFPNILHPGTGFTYDQILLQAAAATVTADPGQIVRMSYVDLSDDIVQVEFSGPGTLSLVLDNPSGPAPAAKYNQPAVSYMKGHGNIVIAGATENTHVSVFSVGTITAANQALFPAGMTYDGLADIASIAILSSNGKFGSVRTANTSYFATKGLTGVYAPGVEIVGPMYVGDLDAFTTATPVLVFGSAADARVTGGDLLQTNAAAVTVSGLTLLNYVAGTKSNGTLLSAQLNQGQLVQNVASGPTVVSVTANKATTDETGSSVGEFTFTRTGPAATALTVSYGVSGSATNGIDYPALVGFLTIPAGATSVKITLSPYPDTTVENTEAVTLTLGSGSGYTVGGATATVSINDSIGTLYVATLRPSASAPASAGSGLATVVLSASGTMATVNVSFSNLSSGQTGAHLFLGNSSSAGDYVLNLPIGQVQGSQWTVAPTATYTSTQIIDALRNGLIYVGLDSTQYPAGELRGAFLSAIGSQTFTPPTAPPAVALTNLTATDAARLLTQATFGPKRSEIDALTGGSVEDWITAQMALPNSSHRARTLAEMQYSPVTNNNNNPNQPYPFHRMQAWFYNVLQGPDQLRQRVAFALSQILVVSDATLNGQQYTEGLAYYYDLLAENAFGSYRSLLEQVTLSPIMGTFLSHLRNAKANPATNTFPDENYAREIMQLFTIGLIKLQPDGTLQLDAQGLPIPTYDNTTITEMAKVFTGWSFFSTATNPNFRSSGQGNYITPMMIYPSQHETSAKTIVNNTAIAANLGGTEDLRITLDTLVGHPNTAPFIAKQLIQRLVTDNPSPAYVYRVAQNFGTNGDLGAMVRAILTDYEARAPAVFDDPGYGKLREPILRLTGILRAFNGTPTSGHYAVNFNNPELNLAQAALRSPSVFNFFEPGYVYPGPLAAAGLVAPEFQITNDTTAISTPNHLRDTIFRAATGTNAANITALNLNPELTIAGNVPALLDHLSLVMTSGQLSAASRARITTALSSLTSTTSATERVQTAILLVATSPEGSSQR